MAGTDESPHSREDPEVTIVIPTRDRPSVLPRAIKSLLRQTFAKVEVLIVDDASISPVVPGTADPRVRMIRLEQNRGVSAARNEGLRLARGSWVVSSMTMTNCCPTCFASRAKPS